MKLIVAQSNLNYQYFKLEEPDIFSQWTGGKMKIQP